MIWSQWNGVNIPPNMIHLPTDGKAPSSDDLSRITFYVPLYMGGIKSLEPIVDMSSLQVVQLLTAGFEDALPYMRPGLTFCTARDVHDLSTAELAVGLAIASVRGFKDFIGYQAAGEWHHERKKILWQTNELGLSDTAVSGVLSGAC
jgi:lactate dehydrogenase-like 2-hydroxyacid dehydrogenase